jgi:hypothetical protein
MTSADGAGGEKGIKVGVNVCVCDIEDIVYSVYTGSTQSTAP